MQCFMLFIIYLARWVLIWHNLNVIGFCFIAGLQNTTKGWVAKLNPTANESGMLKTSNSHFLGVKSKGLSNKWIRMLANALGVRYQSKTFFFFWWEAAILINLYGQYYKILKKKKLNIIYKSNIPPVMWIHHQPQLTISHPQRSSDTTTCCTIILSSQCSNANNSFLVSCWMSTNQIGKAVCHHQPYMTMTICVHWLCLWFPLPAGNMKQDGGQ